MTYRVEDGCGNDCCRGKLSASIGAHPASQDRVLVACGDPSQSTLSRPSVTPALRSVGLNWESYLIVGWLLALAVFL